MEIVNHTSFEAEAIPFKGPDGEAFVTLIVKGTFTVSPEGRTQIADDQLPIAFGDTPYNPHNSGPIQFEADIAPYKPRADILLVGHAYAPLGQAVRGIDVSLRVGRLHRVLRVYGDRQWHCPSLTPPHASEPALFTKMPLTYDRAFGGIDLASGSFCRENPTGRGHFGKVSKRAVNGQPLPNIEDPQNIIRSPKDHPKPVGFGYYGRAWHPRASFLGTYDETWRKTRSPDPPADFKYGYYNAAHPDLQLDGYLEGNEAVELINLTQETPEWRFSLPNLRLTCSVEKSFEALAAYVEQQGLEEHTPVSVAEMKARIPEQEPVQLNLDTLCLLPDEKSFFLLWRGRTAAFDLTALEIDTFTID